MKHMNRRWLSCGILRIMPGACSRASHSVTTNSAASLRVDSSSASASAMVIIVSNTVLRLLRTNLGWISASSMKHSSAS